MNAQTKVHEGLVTELPPIQTNNLPATMHETAPAPSAAPGAVLYPKAISKALITIAKDIGAVEKEGFNSHHNYHYQKWEDVLDAISPLLVDNGLFIQQSQVASTLFDNDALMAISYQFTIIHADGDAWPDRPVWTAVSRLKDAKGVYDDKCANKCHTQAHKYFLLHTFNIKTKEAVEDDADNGGKRTAAPNPNAKPGDPHEVNAKDAKSWAEAYVEAVSGTTTYEAAQEFERINAEKLGKLAKVAPDLFADMRTEVDRHRAALLEAAKPKAPPKPPERTAPNPNAQRAPKPPVTQSTPPGVAEQPSQDADIARAESGRDDGKTETWGENEQQDAFAIPPGADRRTAKAKLLDEIAKLNTRGDLMHFATSKEVYALKEELTGEEGTAVDLAFMQRSKVVKDGAK